jgi:lysophospholipase L1-like esterase
VIAADATRYMALGDSIAAGYKAVPVTNAYPYLLYHKGVFDVIPHTLFCNASVPGATSADVLLHTGGASDYSAGGRRICPGPYHLDCGRQRPRRNLLLIERPGASAFETHMTSAGHQVMAGAFADVIGRNPEARQGPDR